MILKSLLFITFSIFLTLASFGQPLPLSFAVSQGSASFVYSRDVSTDANGNVYNIGEFGGTIDLDPGAGQIDVTSPGGKSVFVSKLDPQGDFLWGFMLASSGSANCDGNAITIDHDGDVYITGSYQATADFDPSANNESLTAEGQGDVFVAKYDTDGNYAWVKSMGGVSEDIGFGIGVDDAKNVYTTGHFYQTADFDPGTNTVNLVSEGTVDAFISKLDSNGDFVWVKQLGGTSDDYAADISVDENNEVVAIGTFWNATAFDPTGANQQFTSNGGNDVWIAKLDGAGSLNFFENIGGTDNESGICMTTDFNNDILVGGTFQGSVDFDNSGGVAQQTMLGNYDAFMLKLTATGGFAWVNHLGGIDNEAIRGLGTDDNGVVYATGFFKETVDFNIDGTPENLTSAGGADSFVAEYDVNGNFAWVHNFGSTGADLGNGIHVNDGAVHLVGEFENTVDFDPSGAVFELTSLGSKDFYTVKLGCTATTGTDVQTACDSYTWIDGNTYTSDNNTATHTLTNAAGCDSIVTLDLTINTVDNSVIDDSPTLTSNAVGATYQWIDCDNANEPITGETNASFTATTNGNYAVIVTENGCTDTSDCITISNVGLEEIQNNNVGLSIYPNPSTGRFAIDHNSSKPVQLKIVDILGKRIYQSELTKKSTIVDLSHQSTGIYFVDVTFDNAVHERRKIIID